MVCVWEGREEGEQAAKKKRTRWYVNFRASPKIKHKKTKHSQLTKWLVGSSSSSMLWFFMHRICGVWRLALIG